VGVDGGGASAGSDADSAAEYGQQDGFGEELEADVGFGARGERRGGARSRSGASSTEMIMMLATPTGADEQGHRAQAEDRPLSADFAAARGASASEG